MTDVHTPEQRSHNMARIRSKDTKPELLLRRELWKTGMRYRLHFNLPGKPDLTFTKQRLVIFIDGCFWHKCPEHFVMPKTRTGFWKEKIEKNVIRDARVNRELSELGWNVIRVWEHEVKADVKRLSERIQAVLNQRIK